MVLSNIYEADILEEFTCSWINIPGGRGSYSEMFRYIPCSRLSWKIPTQVVCWPFVIKLTFKHLSIKHLSIKASNTRAILQFSFLPKDRDSYHDS